LYWASAPQLLFVLHFAQDRILYSFTVPVSLMPAVETVIAEWMKRQHITALEHGLILSLKTEEVCLPSVAL